MEFADVVHTTRAIRRYGPEPVDDADLAEMLFAASRAPSGSNRQPFRFVVLRRTERAGKARALLGKAFRAAWESKSAADGYTTGSGVDADSPKARMRATMEHFVATVQGAPVIVVACVHLRREPTIADGASVYPACQNLLLTARSLGYGGVMTMWHHLVADGLAEALELPDDVVVATVIPLGRPVGSHGPVRRRPLGELVYEDRWGSPAPWAVDPPGTEFTSAGPPRH